jgi:cation-transporting ATPase 13A3/4/5
MCICIIIQAAAFVLVREQPWFIPPKLKHDKSNIKNSENTALFLTSCFEYILSGVVLNAGRPFRQRAIDNWPFVAMISVALLITLNLVLGPMRWVRHLMQLTYISWDFKLVIVGLGVLYFVLAYLGEHFVFQRLARIIGRATAAVTKKTKKRKEYKLIAEKMLF